MVVQNRPGVASIVGATFVAKARPDGYTVLMSASHPAKNVSELVAYAKQNPDKANYAASSASFQLITELFNSRTGTRFTPIPYKGSNDSITAVIIGDVPMTLVDAGAASAALQGGRVKVLAVTSAERLQDEVARVVNLAEVWQRISGMFITPGASSSEDFARLLATEIPRWKQVVLDNKIKAD